jgi:hypothetical protein
MRLGERERGGGCLGGGGGGRKGGDDQEKKKLIVWTGKYLMMKTGKYCGWGGGGGGVACADNFSIYQKPHFSPHTVCRRNILGKIGRYSQKQFVCWTVKSYPLMFL